MSLRRAMRNARKLTNYGLDYEKKKAIDVLPASTELEEQTATVVGIDREVGTITFGGPNVQGT